MGRNWNHLNGMMWKRIIYVFLCAGLILISISCGNEPEAENGLPAGALGTLETILFEIRGVPVEIEVAVTPQEQQQGLMYRDSMPENHGMLFVYPQPQYMSFWMKNTRIPLSIAFIREDGVISNIEDMEPQKGPLVPSERYVSRQKSLYALEMNQGWFDKHGVKEGDQLELPGEEIERIKQKNQNNSLGR